MSKKILLVDDEKTTLDTLRLLIERYAPELELVSVDTGDGAAARLAGEKFDLVISDVMRPGLDGPGLHKLVRASAEHAQTPFVFLTAMPLPPPTDARDHVVRKPFSAKELLERIRRILGIGPKPQTQRLSAEELREAESGTRMKTTRFLARRFEQLFEGHYVRILQRTEKPVAIDLIQRHLLFSRVLSSYNLSEYMLKGAGEVSIEVEDVAALPGRHALRFFLLIRSENPRIPVERVMIPELPEVMLARSIDELTLDAEVQRTIEYVRGVYLATDLTLPEEAVLGSRIDLGAIDFLAHDVMGDRHYANAVVHLKIRPRKFKTLEAWVRECLSRVNVDATDPVVLRRNLVEATLGLEELASFFPDRPNLHKAAAYLSATNLLVRRIHGPTYRGDDCPLKALEPSEVQIRGLDHGEGLEMEDPLGKVLYDNDHWSGVLNQYFFPSTTSSGYPLYAVRLQFTKASHPA